MIFLLNYYTSPRWLFLGDVILYNSTNWKTYETKPNFWLQESAIDADEDVGGKNARTRDGTRRWRTKIADLLERKLYFPSQCTAFTKWKAEEDSEILLWKRVQPFPSGDFSLHVYIPSFSLPPPYIVEFAIIFFTRKFVMSAQKKTHFEQKVGQVPNTLGEFPALTIAGSKRRVGMKEQGNYQKDDNYSWPKWGRSKF